MTSDKKSGISEEDRTLFQNAVGPVKAVKSNTAKITKSPPKPNPIKSREDDRAVINELLSDHLHPDDFETAEHLAYAGPGVQKSVMRKLKKGHYAIQNTLDLHGHTVAKSKVALVEFIHQSRRERTSCVLIIHGKSRHRAEQAPILKPMVNTWLRSHSGVLAFSSAQASDGGTGAVYALLRQAK